MEFNFEQIREILPQRFPFMVIDRIIEMNPGKEALAVKNVSANDVFLPGHSPEKAMMPMVAIIEAMAQTAIVLFSSERERGQSKNLYFLGSVRAQFHHPVVPGDCLKIRVVCVKSLSSGAYVTAEASVDDRRVSEAELIFSAKNE